tara:strand:- start:58146 stop:59645 length:1500 start_codon:yes stop_codon:yes gene_type:complete
MSNLLKESKASFNQQKDQTAKYVAKWEKTGLLEGLDSEYDKHNTAILLENQAKQLISESGNATSTSAGQEDWNGVALPLVRRIFAEISAKDFVSVQPMNLPSGLVFWLDFKYANKVGGHAIGDSVFGKTGTKSDVTDFSKGLYNGPGREGYTLNAVKITAGTTASATTVTLNMADVDPDMLMSAYFISASGAPVIAESVNTTTGVVTFASAAGTGTQGDVYYYAKPVDAGDRGDFEAVHTIGSGGNTLEEANLNIPELNVELEQEALIAKTRKLKVVWTPEFAQDLNAYHSIDAEAELTSMLSEYVAMEIDLEILQMLHANAGFTGSWNANPDVVADNAGYQQTGSIWAYQLGSHNATIGYEIQKLSNKIHRATMRGGANFIVCSPDVATILETIPGFAVDTDGDKDSFAAGVEKIGNFANRYKVYKNPYWNSDDMIIGFRGNQFLETGAVYAPYIPLIMTPLVYDPNNFTPRKGVMTRYAKKVVRKDFFAKLSVKNKI